VAVPSPVAPARDLAAVDPNTLHRMVRGDTRLSPRDVRRRR